MEKYLGVTLLVHMIFPLFNFLRKWEGASWHSETPQVNSQNDCQKGQNKTDTIGQGWGVKSGMEEIINSLGYSERNLLDQATVET